MARNKPKYRGKTVHKIVNKITGEIGEEHLNTLLDHDTEVTIVCQAIVSNVGYPTTTEGVVCKQTIKVLEGYIVTDELDSADLLHKLHTDRVEELDKLLGTGPGDE